MKKQYGGKRTGAGRKPGPAKKTVSVHFFLDEMERIELARGELSLRGWIRKKCLN